MRIIKNLKNSKLAVLLILLLLLVQATADLSLPRYTADIVDIGIQQSGLKHNSPDKMSAQTFDILCAFLDEKDENFVKYSYSSEGEYYLIDSNIGDEARERLDAVLDPALVFSEYVQTTEDVHIRELLDAYDAGKPEAIEALKQELMLGEDVSLLKQQAAQATLAEYRRIGVDTAEMQMKYLTKQGFAMLGLASLGMAASIGIAFLASRTGAKVGRMLRSQFFSKVVQFSEKEINSFSAASLITRGTNDIQQIQMVTIMLLRMLLYAPILAIGGIIMVSRVNVSMTWIILLAVVVITVCVSVLFAIAMPKFRIMQKLIDQVNLVSREILTGMSVIRAFNRQKHESERFAEASKKLMDNQLFVNRVMAFMMPLMFLIMNCVSVLIVWVGGSHIDSGNIETGDMIAFITYAMMIVSSFLMISMMAVVLPRAIVAAQRIDEVIQTEAEYSVPESSLGAGMGDLDRTKGAKIAFENVDFAYPGAPSKILSQVSFTAEAAETTAFIGSTGSGKSTVLKLIERFYEVTGGAVSIDGINVKDLPLGVLRKELGYVPQKAFLFSGTIGSNISYSDSSMGQDRIELAAEIAQAASFIEEKEGSYESPVSQGGSNVSGGQRQRISIARALASDARVFLFDDSFSALDYKTETALRNALSKKLSGKTVLIVAQRISSIMDADKIVVLDEGRVVGIGTHNQLLSSCPCYYEIASSQLSQEELGAVMDHE